MKIIGIDPGLSSTGYGILDYRKPEIKLIEVGIITPKQKDLIQNRILKIYNTLIEIIEKHQPEVLVLEKLYAHYKHPATAIVMGHLRGVVCLLCAQRNISLIESSVKRVRSAVVGNGNATKLQTQRYVANFFKIDQNQLTLDASDALALALSYVYLQSRKI